MPSRRRTGVISIRSSMGVVMREPSRKVHTSISWRRFFWLPLEVHGHGRAGGQLAVAVEGSLARQPSVGADGHEHGGGGWSGRVACSRARESVDAAGRQRHGRVMMPPRVRGLRGPHHQRYTLLLASLSLREGRGLGSISPHR
jgi:hypothetical protein